MPVANYTGMLSVKRNGVGRQFGGMARPIPSERPGHYYRENDCVDAVQGWTGQPQVSLLRRPMAKQPITLDFLANQLDHILDQQGRLEARIAVLTRIWMRLDGVAERLATEARDNVSDPEGRA
jgi:hypothetical protein